MTGPYIPNLPIFVLAAVFLLIAVRQVGRFRFQIWEIMLVGALAVVINGDIPVPQILPAINLDVMLFLFGMFVVGEALNESGYLYHLSYRLFIRAKSLDHLVLLILFGIGGLAALLMNDTLAIICTPLMLYFARQNGISPKLLLLTLAFGVTTATVASPIGSPHNLLIALDGGVKSPFVMFLLYLGVPTILCLLIAYRALKLFFPREFNDKRISHIEEQISDVPLANLSRISLWIIVCMIGLKVLAPYFHTSLDFSLTFIALIAALPILAVSDKRWQVLRQIDWRTLVFFAAMFVLMKAVWGTGFFQQVMSDIKYDPRSVPMILTLSSLVSQLVSNVPFVALYLPMIANGHHVPIATMALAAGSTIAGNLFILGAASNIIIVQNAERHGQTLTFVEFARVGLPLTVVQLLVYWGWLELLQYLMA